MESRPDDRRGAELEEALSQSERILAVVDQVQWRMRVIRLAEVAVGLSAALVALLAGVYLPERSTVSAVVALGLVAMLSAAAGVVLENIHRVTKRQLERDLSVMVELSRMVRDLVPVVAKEERWSDLRRITTRARISRFPISEKSR